jgi:hypothetical protein
MDSYRCASFLSHFHLVRFILVDGCSTAPASLPFPSITALHTLNLDTLVILVILLYSGRIDPGNWSVLRTVDY